jgi:hypothetical protein
MHEVLPSSVAQAVLCILPRVIGRSGFRTVFFERVTTGTSFRLFTGESPFPSRMQGILVGPWSKIFSDLHAAKSFNSLHSPFSLMLLTHSRHMHVRFHFGLLGSGASAALSYISRGHWFFHSTLAVTPKFTTLRQLPTTYRTSRSKHCVRDQPSTSMSFQPPTMTLEIYAANHLTPCVAPNDWECPICYDEYTRTGVVSTHCNHLFHRDCLLESLSTPDVQWSNQCPACRAKLFYLRKTATGFPHPDFPIEVIQQAIAHGVQEANRRDQIRLEPFAVAQMERSVLRALDSQQRLGAEQVDAEHAPLIQLALTAQQALTDLQQSLIAQQAFLDQRRVNAQQAFIDYDWRRLSAQLEVPVRERLRPLAEGAVRLMDRWVPPISFILAFLFFIIAYMSVVSHRTEVMSMFNTAVTTVRQTSANLFQARAPSSFQSPYTMSAD